MKSIGSVAKAAGRDISRASTGTTSSTNGRNGADSGRNGSGAPPPKPRWGQGLPDCPKCKGIGWLRKDVEVTDPDFGRVFACECIADELAERRLAGVRDTSNVAALGRMTFDSFAVDAPGNPPEGKQTLGAAYAAASHFADEPHGWLVLSGSYGCGKTHLAAAIVNERLARGGSALFVVVPDLLDHLRAAFGAEEQEGLERRLETVRNAPLLVLDDLGAQASTAWSTEKLFQILNHRYNANLPTVITMNVTIEDLDERLRSRLGDIEMVQRIEIKALDYRGGIDPGRQALSTLYLYDDATFESWRHRAGELTPEDVTNLHRAYEMARRFADRPEGWLVYTGDYGSGKTHLAAAIAHHRVALGDKALFVGVPDLLDHLRATFSPNSRVSYDERFEEVRSAAFLVLDDLGTESATPWAQEKLYQILNFRYAARLPTVITMSCAVDQVHARIRTRMLDRTRCTVFAILAPSFTEGPRPTRGRSRGR